MTHPQSHHHQLLTPALQPILLFIIILLAGCATPDPSNHSFASPFQPANLYLHQPTLPSTIRRVALLPITHNPQNHTLRAGAESLQPILISESHKNQSFEIVTVSPDQLRALTGLTFLSASSQLPPDFLTNISQSTGCDAVLLADLTSFHPYPPIQIGWKARLVDCQNQITWWAIDETFDAGSPNVAAAAKEYARNNLAVPGHLAPDNSIPYSPRRFGQYTAAAILNTLPIR